MPETLDSTRTSGWGRLFRTKNVDEMLGDSEESGHKLKRVLGPFHVTMMGIGAIIGAGIFATVGTAAVGDNAHPGAGPALIVSFVLTSIACGFAALCYAEFAAMAPVAGSAYTYSYATLGELVAWIIGWDLILEYAIGNVGVAISWSSYFQTFLDTAFHIKIPTWLGTDYRSFIQNHDIFLKKTLAEQALVPLGERFDLSTVPHFLKIPIIFNLPAVLVVLGITAVLVVGIRLSAWFNTTVVVTKLVVLGVFIAVGLYYFKAENLHPFAPNGISGIWAGASVVFFAFIGFDAVSTAAEETRNPKRDMPIGIIGSLLICTVLYILLSVALMGMIPFQNLKDNLADPLVGGLTYNHAPSFFVGFTSFGAVVALLAVLLVFQLGQPRIFFSMSRDGLLPMYFARVHPRFKTPHVATLWTGILVAGFSAFCNIQEMVDLCNIGTLFAFILVCAGIMILRVKDPLRPRPFRVWGGPVVPILGIVSCGFLILGLDWITWLRFVVWLAIGLVIYFLYGIRRSVVQRRRQEEGAAGM